MAVIFTNHAKERMSQRHLAESDIERVLRSPDRTHPGKKRGTVKFIKDIDGRNHQIVAKLLENGHDWLVLSVWVRGKEDSNWVQTVALFPFKVIWWVVKKIFSK